MPLSPAEQIYAETMETLAGSLRSEAEMIEAASVLDPLLDAHERLAATGDADTVARLDALSERILWAAKGVRSGKSGMAVDLCLDLLRLAYDDARAELGRIG